MTRYAGTFEQAAQDLAKAVEGSVAGCVSGHRKVGVAFSGGVDSSILVACAKRHAEVAACCGHAESSLDGRRAVCAGEALGVEVLTTRLTREGVEDGLKEMELPFEPSAMDRSLWSLFSEVSRVAAEGGAEVIMLGQLADELFGGYAKYQDALVRRGEEAAERLMVEDLAEYPERGRIRDVRACSRWLEPKFPYEAAEVRDLGVSMPVSFKIRDGVRKAVLRRSAVILGVPEELAMVPKKAAQYSSGAQKIVRTIRPARSPGKRD